MPNAEGPRGPRRPQRPGGRSGSTPGGRGGAARGPRNDGGKPEKRGEGRSDDRARRDDRQQDRAPGKKRFGDQRSRGDNRTERGRKSAERPFRGRDEAPRQRDRDATEAPRGPARRGPARQADDRSAGPGRGYGRSDERSERSPEGRRGGARFNEDRTGSAGRGRVRPEGRPERSTDGRRGPAKFDEGRSAGTGRSRSGADDRFERAPDKRRGPAKFDDRKAPAAGRAHDRSDRSPERRGPREEGERTFSRPQRAQSRPAYGQSTDGHRPVKLPSSRTPSPAAVRKPAAEGEAPREGDRIAKLLARAGIASRRDIERMIEEQRIAINGEIVTTPATLLTSLQGVTVDGKPVREPGAAQLFLFYKPPGYLTAARDPLGRPTIYDRLPPELPRVMPVGRLDMTTEGLLLLTTDGELKRQLELPSTGVERTYRARAFGEVSQAQLEELIDGVEIDGMRYGRIDANLERRTGHNQWIEMTITEGKNREVRRVLEYLGLTVNRLIRTRYGPFTLDDAQPGEIVEVRAADVAAFRKTLKTK